MNLLQILIVLSGIFASLVTFVLMRYPQTRRVQFRSYAGFSFMNSLLGSLLIFAVFCGIAIIQG